MTDDRSFSKPRILVIDDELGIREGCRRVLSPHGYQVKMAENGPDGLHKARQEGPFDLVLWRNLLLNAIQYTPAGGQITETLRQDDKGQIVGAVRDTGIGLSTDEIPRIFEDFHRTDAAKEQQELGSGLGMSIIESILEQYKGSLEVESEPGQGSTFTFTLPPHPPPTDAEDLIVG